MAALGDRVAVAFALGLAVGVADGWARTRGVGVAALGALLVAVAFAARLLLVAVAVVAGLVVAVACGATVAGATVTWLVGVAAACLADAVGEFSADARLEQL